MSDKVLFFCWRCKGDFTGVIPEACVRCGCRRLSLGTYAGPSEQADDAAVLAFLGAPRAYARIKAEFPEIRKVGKVLRRLRLAGLIDNRSPDGQGWVRVAAGVFLLTPKGIPHE